MDSSFHTDLSHDLSLILNDADDYDVIIQIGENQAIKEFHAHSNILRARSPYFKSALSNNWITKKNDMIEFKKPNINPIVFETILKYIYTGEVDLYKKPGEDIFGVLIASDELLLEKLFEYIQDHLIENQKTWVKQNFVLVLNTVFKLSNCKKLQDHYLEYISADPTPFITSNEFPSLDKDILYELLKRDDLQIKEIVIWNYLIKWGIKQTPELKNLKIRFKLNKKNYEALKKTLNQFIPLIRFVEISFCDFLDNVLPYKAIIPHHTYREIFKYYYKNILSKTITLSPRNGKIQIESKLIKPKLANIIAGWIERKNEKGQSLTKKYRFDILYRSSRDGINTNTFRAKCNNRGPCLVLVKNHQSTKIYGGYNPITFKHSSGQWYDTTESFIFSFENSQDFQNMKISRVKSCNSKFAIYETCSKGFNFGGMFYMSGIYINFFNTGYYDNNIGVNPNLGTRIIPEEIEVFKMSTS